MYYERKITTIPGYTAGSPLETKLKAVGGVLCEGELEFPPKMGYTVGVSLWLSGHPIIPSNAGDYVVSDGHVVRFKEWIELKHNLNTVTIKTYNTSDDHNHVVIVRFTVLEDWQITPWLSVNRLIDFIKKLLARMGAA